MERRDRERDREKLALISEEAAEWLVRMRDERLGSADRLRYARWLKQSPNHIAEMLRVAALNGYLDANKVKKVSWAEASSNVVGLARGMGVGPDRPLRGLRDASVDWLNRKVASALSAVAVAVVVGAVVLFNLHRANLNISTDVGEWRRVTLSDGSVVNVGPRSNVSFDFSDVMRRDVFLSSGEAQFQVAKNPERPFLVRTDLAVVRAVGTQFGVTKRGDRVSVTVKEGKVAVTKTEVAQRSLLLDKERDLTGSAEIGVIPLKADEQITVTASAWPEKPQRIDASRELAWAQGHLIFDETTTVGEAAEEFNRRNRVQVIVDDPEVAALRVCCVFNIDDPESFAQSVVSGMRKRDLRLVREGTGVLRLVTVREPGAE